MKKLFFLALFMAFPVQAFASGCDCGSINNMLTAHREQTVQAINAHTTAEAEAIRSEILQAAQNIIGTMKAESATIVRAIVALKESNAAYMKGQAIAGQTMKTEDMYGKASQPSGLCGSSSLGAGVQLGAKAGKEVQATMREKQIEYGNREGAKPVEHLQRVLEDEHPSEQETVDSIFPLNTTLSEDQVAQAHESVKTMANPRPLPVITDEQKDTPSGQVYAAARKVHEARMETVMDALNNHVAMHSPTMPDDITEWAKNQWNEAGGSGTPPWLVDDKLSEAGLYKLLSQMRMGNPNWFTQISEATDTGLLRELVMLQAFQFEIARKNNELLDRLTVIASLDYLTRMEGTTGKELEDLYTRMVGAQQ